MLLLGSEFPDFKAATTQGDISLYEWMEQSWAILCSHPADYTPVCTTELARLLKLQPEFAKRNVKTITLSCDSLDNHNGWTKDILRCAEEEDVTLPYPIIADVDRELAVKLNMIDLNLNNDSGLQMTARAVFIVDDKKKLRLSILYPATVGRNFNEILRVIDALQLADKHRIATPADWKVGDAVMVQPSVSQEEAIELFPNLTMIELPSEKNYLRQTLLP